MAPLLRPQGRPQPLDTPVQAAAIRLDAPDEGLELSAREARDAFERLFRDLLVRRENQRIVDAAQRRG